MKIADNPTLQLLKRQIDMLEEKPLNLAEKIKIAEFRRNFEELSTIGDTFNLIFSSRGWVAYENLDIRIVRKAVSIAKSKGVSQANDYLIDIYDQDTLKSSITKLWGVEPFRNRLHLIKLAYEDHLCGRYHACIPVLLMMIDGVVADAGNNLGFFSESSDVSAWDSIAGHGTGLSAIKSIFYSPRAKTSKNKIDLPYRNGIIHGRDLGYANREVAAKCWALLFTVRDLLAARRDETVNKARYELDKDKSIGDFQHEMQVLHDELREVIEMDSFKRAPVVFGSDVPWTGVSFDYPKNTPERALVEFIELWKSSNFGSMADRIYLSSHITKSKMAGRIRQTFTDKKPHQFTFVKSYDLSSCNCDITLNVGISYKEGYVADYLITFRLLYCTPQGTELVVDTSKEGRWKVVNNFSEIDQIGTSLDYLDDQTEA